MFHLFIQISFNPPDALWLWQRKMFAIVMYFIIAPQRDNQVRVSALLRVGQKMSETTNLVSLAHPSTWSISTWTMAKVSTDVHAVVDRLLSHQWYPASYHSNGIPQVKHFLKWHPASKAVPQIASFKLSWSRSLDHCLHVCWNLCHRPCASWLHRPVVRDTPTRFATLLTLCPARRGAETVSLQSHFKIHNKNKPFSSMLQSQSIECVKQKLGNNCQTTKIATKLVLSHFFEPPSTGWTDASKNRQPIQGLTIIDKSLGTAGLAFATRILAPTEMKVTTGKYAHAYS